MDQALNFSLSYEQLTREAEDAIKKGRVHGSGVNSAVDGERHRLIR